ncbi:MAG: leucine--tRNA ligase [Candidatus Aenigmarchaeota archaeon]|nr:leucine--tRNA ligase [Candidatus Aenigmarchaeota archaeon]
MDFAKIEKKWQQKWNKSKIFETNPGQKKKFFTSIIIPYVNGRMHIGHSYTYTRTDAYARFKRMQGYNTLLAQGFHATGEPIVGAVERLKNGDKSQAETFRMFGATEKNVSDFIKLGPEFVAKFWMKKFMEDSNSIGYSIDWRRSFVTTSMSPQFSRFIEWQYNTLRKKGYVVQGTHPVIWCPHDQSPTGDHDRLEGEGESPVEYTGVKFRMEDAFLVCATLRPETVYGVTNIWINPDATYLKIKAGGEKWIVSRECFYKLKDQIKHVEKICEIQLAGKKCIDIIGNREIPILPSHFVDAESATGIVMSVPAHAPYDWMALKELIDKNGLEAYGLSRADVEPIILIDSGSENAMEMCARMKITSTGQRDILENATKNLYKKEFHNGVLNDKCGPYAGLKVLEAKDKIISDFVSRGIAHPIWDCPKVVCRCTTRCHVKILENQWFLKYSDTSWKDMARKCLAGMRIVPVESRQNFENTIDWLKDKACARKSGLGTPLPWDKDWIVETLSDSTVYMAYYTIAGIINKNKISAKSLTDEVFDYVFLGKGDPKAAAKRGKIPPKTLASMRSEFEYFYPIDMRNSAKDLIQNHLTFYIMHHVALWGNRYWPRGISTNGYVNIEGQKMSKSRGNFIVVKDVIKNFGADMVRINIACSSEGLEDADWRVENIRSYRSRIELLFNTIKGAGKSGSMKGRTIDEYLISRLQKHKKDAAEAFSDLRLRSACQSALFETTNDLKWYLRRCGGMKNANKKTLKIFMYDVIRLLAPLVPHISEEMWRMTGGRGFVSLSAWPTYDKSLPNSGAELWEKSMMQTLADIEEIRGIIGKEAKKCTLFVAEDWKFKTLNKIIKNKDMPLDEITRGIMQSDARRYGKATLSFIQSAYSKSNEITGVIGRDNQLKLLNESKWFLKSETGLEISIEDAEKSQNQKARNSTPYKFGILLE